MPADVVPADDGDLLRWAAAEAGRFRATLPSRPVAPDADADADTVSASFAGPLPRQPSPPGQVLEQLVAAADPGLMATAGPRFFGFVIGGSLPAATAADVLAVGWDQVAFNPVTSPAAAAAEDVAGGWLKELLGLPAAASAGFVTGAQAANIVGLAAARHHVLREAGWDVERDGLLGAPPVRVVASVERHATVDTALRLLGLGTSVVVPVAATANGALDMVDLERVLDAGATGPTIVCLQSGNVNTGACDDLRTGCDLTHRQGGWVHVDGAFGLWAAASPATRHLVDGVDLADSGAVDGHKWLNVPYDSGFAFCSRPDAHAAALSYSADYLVGSGGPVPLAAELTLESSRRARGFRGVGGAHGAGQRRRRRAGRPRLPVGPPVRRVARRRGRRGGERRRAQPGARVSFGADARTDEVIAAAQRDGTCWMGGTSWRGRRLMRISVSNWSTTEDDVDRSVAAILRLAGM